MKHMTIFVLALAATLVLPTRGEAQANGVSDVEAELRSMVTPASETDTDRDVVLDFLDREDVGTVGFGRGLDVDAMKDGVRALDDEAAADLAHRVRDMQQDPDQVGGDTLVITSTTVIIVLLILIFVAVA